MFTTSPREIELPFVMVRASPLDVCLGVWRCCHRPAPRWRAQMERSALGVVGPPGPWPETGRGERSGRAPAGQAGRAQAQPPGETEPPLSSTPVSGDRRRSWRRAWWFMKNGRDFHRQKARMPARCHRTTVAGWPISSTWAQRDETRRSTTEKSRSASESFGRGPLFLSALTCWHRARLTRISATLRPVDRCPGYAARFCRYSRVPGT